MCTVGRTMYDTQEAYISDSFSFMQPTQHTVYHEFGHALDEKDFKYSSSDEFSCIFGSEKKNLLFFSRNVYFSTGVHEFFADSFALYM